MTQTAISELSAAQREAAERIDSLDLEPVAYKLMHPEPGQAVMTLAEADQLIAAYRCFLKLCAWYPAESIVPAKAIDKAWHTHILDTAKYADDSQAVFGYFLHLPYLGLRGPDDETAWHAAYARTGELFRQHFGTGIPESDGSCQAGGAVPPARPRPCARGHRRSRRPPGRERTPAPRQPRKYARAERPRSER